MAAGAQNLHLPSAVPLTSPFELQHQIFREHPAPEQLFLIATSQHCCLCLYINIYSVLRTEHQSPALPPQPPAGQEPTASQWAPGPIAAPQSLAGHRCLMLAPHRGAGRRERPPACFPRRCSSPHLRQHPTTLERTVLGPDRPNRPSGGRGPRSPRGSCDGLEGVRVGGSRVGRDAGEQRCHCSPGRVGWSCVSPSRWPQPPLSRHCSVLVLQLLPGAVVPGAEQRSHRCAVSA